MKNTFIIIFSLFLSFFGTAQDTLLILRDTTSAGEDLPESVEPIFTKLNLKGKIYSAMISEGDTLILADLDDVSITSFRKFETDADYKKYQKFRRYAAKVFPYAKEGIRIFREVEYASQHLSRRERKKRIKELEVELKAEFEQPLSKLTKLQGKILIKMIEKETDASMYYLMKQVKGRFTAFYWNQFSKLYSYDLKEGYQVGKYEILDAVLQDFDLSYRIENGTDLKYVRIDDVRDN
ncbi:MAG: hypothetical protein ACJA1A_001062 [Saprospiraceae bacterium]|jgi:hypothetical protein|tara:strand:- start:540 stop:1250 length:711 start_codon:yes stop_codon:yes gene_type:complete